MHHIWAERRKWYIFPCVIQINTKFANFAGLYFPHFTTFRGQTLQLQITNFNISLSSCGDGFFSSCLDQNLVYSWNRPLCFLTVLTPNLNIVWKKPGSLCILF